MCFILMFDFRLFIYIFSGYGFDFSYSGRGGLRKVTRPSGRGGARRVTRGGYGVGQVAPTCGAGRFRGYLPLVQGGAGAPIIWSQSAPLPSLVPIGLNVSLSQYTQTYKFTRFTQKLGLL